MKKKLIAVGLPLDIVNKTAREEEPVPRRGHLKPLTIGGLADHLLQLGRLSSLNSTTIPRVILTSSLTNEHRREGSVEVHL
ncbi:MAG: hypothetical protein NTU47_02395 [Ignavibacteriales bacterium]|nr:hypothetical protein [Ignavibacteriales bacterium]